MSNCTINDQDILPGAYPESRFSIEQLSGAEEDAAALNAVVAEARATQDLHREMVQRAADWEVREPGRLASDTDLRLAFIDNLDGLRSAFTDRALPLVGVSFPMMLDRTNPAQAVIVAVRDDIADTADRLRKGQAQALVGKQVSEIRAGQLVKVAENIVNTAADALKGGGGGLLTGMDKFAEILKYAAWGVGAIALLYGLNLVGGLRSKSNPGRRSRRRHRRSA